MATRCILIICNIKFQCLYAIFSATIGLILVHPSVAFLSPHCVQVDGRIDRQREYIMDRFYDFQLIGEWPSIELRESREKGNEGRFHRLQHKSSRVNDRKFVIDTGVLILTDNTDRQLCTIASNGFSPWSRSRNWWSRRVHPEQIQVNWLISDHFGSEGERKMEN